MNCRDKKRSLFQAVGVLLSCLTVALSVSVMPVQARQASLSYDRKLALAPTPTPTPTPTPPTVGTAISMNLDPESVMSGVSTEVTVSGKLTRTDNGTPLAGMEVKIDWPIGTVSITTDVIGNYSYTLMVQSTQSWALQVSFSAAGVYARSWNTKTLVVPSPLRISLTSWSVSKADPRPNEIITFSYAITSLEPEPAAVWLGASIRQTGTGAEYLDFSKDKEVQITPGFNWYSREFTIPEEALFSCDVYLSLWLGEPEAGLGGYDFDGEAVWLDGTGWLPERLNVPYPDLNVSSLTVSPAYGDTETEFVFSVTAEGGSGSYSVYLRDGGDRDVEPQSSGSGTISFEHKFSTPGSYFIHAVVVDQEISMIRTNDIGVMVDPIGARRPEITDFVIPEGTFKTGDTLTFQVGIKNSEAVEKKFSVRLAVSAHTSPTMKGRIWDEFTAYNATLQMKASEVKQISAKWQVPEGVWPGACGVFLRVADESGNLLVQLQRLGFLVGRQTSYIEAGGAGDLTLVHIYLTGSDVKLVQSSGAGVGFSLNAGDIIQLLSEVPLLEQEMGDFLTRFRGAISDPTNTFLPAYTGEGFAGLSVLYRSAGGTMAVFGESPYRVVQEYKGRKVGDIQGLLTTDWWGIALNSISQSSRKQTVMGAPEVRMSPFYATFGAPLFYVFPENVKQSRGEQVYVAVSCDPRDRGVSFAEVSISFDPAALEVSDVSPGALLGGDAVIAKNVDNGAGSVRVALARASPALPPTREGALAYIVFAVKNEAKGGEYRVSIMSAKLRDEADRYLLRIGVKHGTVTLGNLAGDADGNGIVDYRDLAILGASYRKSKGNAGFNPSADFNGDDRVDDKDLVILKANYRG